jgi:hypothetical protein
MNNLAGVRMLCIDTGTVDLAGLTLEDQTRLEVSIRECQDEDLPAG